MPHTLRSILPDQPLCAKECAQMLGVTVRTLSKLMDENGVIGGTIHAWRHGNKGRWRFDRLEVLLYIQRRKAESGKSQATLQAFRRK